MAKKTKAKAKNKGGRPPKYKTAATFTRKTNEYFEKGGAKTKDGNFTLYTVQGYCVWLDITRQTLMRYKDDERFSDTIKRALERIEQNNLEGTALGYLNPAIIIFNLKNNFGWKDTQSIEHSGTVKIQKLEEILK
jgi:hypothetical protein